MVVVVVGVALTSNARDWVPHWLRVKAMRRLSPAGDWSGDKGRGLMRDRRLVNTGSVFQGMLIAGDSYDGVP